MKKLFLILILGSMSLPACKRGANKQKGKKTLTVIKTTTRSSIDLYPVDSSFDTYFPDTSLNFTDGEKLKEYWKKSYLRFASFCNYERSIHGNQDSMELAIRNAQIHADDLWEVINFKYCESVKNLNSMNLLSETSPFSNIIPLHQKIDLYNSFPKKIKESVTGKKTYQILRKLAFDQNKGQNFHQYDKTILIDSQDNNTSLKTVLKISSRYRIISFGASWCRSCILGERQLKQWMPLLDTNLIKVVALSIDTDKDKWHQYINKERYPWPCYLLENGGMDNEMVRGLKFEAIPINFLIDETGKVLSENIDIRKILLDIPEIPKKTGK